MKHPVFIGSDGIISIYHMRKYSIAEIKATLTEVYKDGPINVTWTPEFAADFFELPRDKKRDHGERK